MHVSMAVNLTVVLPETFRRLMAFRSDLLHHLRAAPILREKYEAVSGGGNE